MGIRSLEGERTSVKWARFDKKDVEAMADDGSKQFTQQQQQQQQFTQQQQKVTQPNKFARAFTGLATPIQAPVPVQAKPIQKKAAAIPKLEPIPEPPVVEEEEQFDEQVRFHFL